MLDALLLLGLEAEPAPASLRWAGACDDTAAVFERLDQELAGTTDVERWVDVDASVESTATDGGLDPARRGGILTQLAFVARHSHNIPTDWYQPPTRRGRGVNEAVSCFEIPAPPPGTEPPLAEATKLATHARSNR